MIDIDDIRLLMLSYKTVVEDKKLISFDDMISRPVLDGLKTKKYSMILIDEVQDLSPSQVRMIDCIQAERIIMVGDRNQQIYSFKSADPMVYEKIEKKYQPKEYPMNQCFRCPNLILKHARTYVPEIWSDIDGGSFSNKKIDIMNAPENCFILSRVNAELVKLAATMLDEKIHFSINPQIVRTLTREITYSSQKINTIEGLRKKLLRRMNFELNKAKKNKWNTDRVYNKYDTLMVVADQNNSIGEVKRFLSNLSSAAYGSSGRKLSTIHAAKGLESENVIFINSYLSEKFEEKALEGHDYISANEERNLRYVAITRSLKNLTIF